MDNLSDIGIWTSGKLNRLDITDESRLDDMLDNEFDKMEQLFKGIYDEGEVRYKDGIASDFYRYSNKVSESLTGDIALLMESKNKQYDALGDDIAEMEAAMGDYEQKLWDEFTRMEDALANMKSQTEYLQAMFSNGN